MVNVKKIKPLFTRIITTANRYEEDGTLGNGTLLDVNKQEGRYKEYQQVISIGSSVREVKEGDTVLIDPSRYMKRRYSDNSLRNDFVENPIVEINIPTVQMDGQDYFLIDIADVVYVMEEFTEEAEETPKQQNIILPKEPKIVV